MKRMILIPLTTLALLFLHVGVHADDPAADLDKPGPTPELPPQEDRASPGVPAGNTEGPATIPHRTRGQQLDLRHNRCMDCHGDEAPEEIQATSLPSSHYRNRDEERLDHMSGGRQDCRACHVPEHRTGQRKWGE